jgi:hypothetical protein
VMTWPFSVVIIVFIGRAAMRVLILITGALLLIAG